MTCAVPHTGGGRRSRRRRGPKTRRCRAKSHRRCKHSRRKKKQRGGSCVACNQTGGSALVSAIVPSILLTALYKLTKNKTKRRGSTRKRRR